MPDRAEKSLFDAVRILAQTGNGELAHDLGQLLNRVDLSDLDMTQDQEAAELLDLIFDCASLDEIADYLDRLCKLFDLTHGTLFCAREGGSEVYNTRLVTTLDHDWVAEYTDKRFYYVDPVMLRCRTGTGSFFWDELEVTDPIVISFMQRAIERGVGPSGYSFLTKADNGDVFAMSFSSQKAPDAFRRDFTPKIADVETISKYLIQAFVDTVAVGRPQSPRVTDDQLMVLRAIATGQTREEISRLKFSYGSFRTIEMSINRTFNTKSIEQAAVLAGRLGLLNSTPLLADLAYVVALKREKAFREVI